MDAFIVASDIGGTFTDTVTIDADGVARRYKAPTVPEDPAGGVLATLELAAQAEGVELRDLLARVSLFAHGTTVATNALLEGRTAVVGLLQTRGFGDTVSIMRGFKSLGLDEDGVKNFRSMVKQELVVPKRLTREVGERVDYRGRVVAPLDEDGARIAIRELHDLGVEVFAVALLWSFKNPDHERRVGEIIESELPGTLYTLSSDLLPRLGEYRRTVTTALNASLRPVVAHAVENLAGTLRERGLAAEPQLMQSNGGLAPVAEIDREAASTVMSGPVGGVVACEYLGALRGNRNIVATDMGGTSFEVGLILDGKAHIANSTWVGRHELALPSVAVRTVGAGSGSIASVSHGLLRVGPESAGAVPGPACYGRGGEQPTVADADLVLGYINPDNFLAGRLTLDVERARAAIGTHVAEPLGLSVETAAEGIKTIVDSRMSDLIRRATIEQGHDPADFVLYAYGGAGPSHAFSYGAELGVSEIVIPLTASVHSAFGVAASDLTVAEELSDPLLSPPGTTDYARAIDAAEINARFERLGERAIARLARAGVETGSPRISRSVEMRFRFQIHVLTVPVGEEPLDDDGVRALVERFIETYEARFGEGSAFVAAGIELTTFRVVLSVPGVKPQLRMLESASGGAPAAAATRPVFSAGQWTDARIVDRGELRPGLALDGLAVIELEDTTIVIGPGQQGVIDDYGNVVISDREGGANR
ncbi:MAG TPA: hydantoinase/oxoprolinase family protein [Solirubrobacteraceae bacterium]|jgi:N-methylhydantoinase A|nr:hydantoinase/oxoprolinase family protein [Solirubrobacteraceae bacterium]